MNIIKIMGGLGNQLFQYSFGKVIREKSGENIAYDVTWYTKEKNKHRPFRLFDLGLQVGVSMFDRKQRIIKEIAYDPYILSEKGANYYGYWQYLDYYPNEIFDELKKTISVAVSINKFRHILNRETVALHVRRGDYEQNDLLLPIEYYEQALIELNNPTVKVLVFSDDIPWCKINLPEGYEYVYIKDKDYICFMLMSLCSHNIISRSTFSWWAAMLNTNPRKIVIAPERFVVREQDKDHYNNKIHYPHEWIKI